MEDLNYKYTHEIFWLEDCKTKSLKFTGSLKMSRGLASIVIFSNHYKLEYKNSDRDRLELELEKEDSAILGKTRFHNLYYNEIEKSPAPAPVYRKVFNSFRDCCDNFVFDHSDYLCGTKVA